MGINHITLMGNVARGPEYRMTPNGVPTCSFSVAVTRPPRQEGGAEITDYIRVVTWRNLAEKVNESIQKGDLITLEGRLQTRSYETQDGQRRKSIEIEASNVETVRTGATPAGGPQYEASDEEFGDFEAPAPAPRSTAPARRPAPAPAPAADLDDEIPF